MSQIFCFGASITSGRSDSQGGWAVRLRNYLYKKDSDIFRVFNLGVSGDTTSEVVKRLDDELKVRQRSGVSNLVLFGVGNNDSKFNNENKQYLTPKKTYKENIYKCIKIARRYSEKIIFLDSLPVVDAKVDPIPLLPSYSYRNKYIWEYREILKNICEVEKVCFIDAYDKLLASSDYMHSLADGIHPSDIGHEILFKIIKDYLEKEKLI